MSVESLGVVHFSISTKDAKEIGSLVTKTEQKQEEGEAAVYNRGHSR
jgi:hypothetical protein